MSATGIQRNRQLHRVVVHLAHHYKISCVFLTPLDLPSNQIRCYLFEEDSLLGMFFGSKNSPHLFTSSPRKDSESKQEWPLLAIKRSQEEQSRVAQLVARASL